MKVCENYLEFWNIWINVENLFIYIHHGLFYSKNCQIGNLVIIGERESKEDREGERERKRDIESDESLCYNFPSLSLHSSILMSFHVLMLYYVK